MTSRSSGSLELDFSHHQGRPSTPFLWGVFPSIPANPPQHDILLDSQLTALIRSPSRNPGCDRHGSDKILRAPALKVHSSPVDFDRLPSRRNFCRSPSFPGPRHVRVLAEPHTGKRRTVTVLLITTNYVTF